MFKKILIPLDGSKLAECALTYAEDMAKNYDGAELIFISITEKVSGIVDAEEVKEAYIHSDKGNIGEVQTGSTLDAFLSPIGNFASTGGGSTSEPVMKTTYSLGKLEAQAAKYLAKIARKFEAKGIPVKYEVLMGHPAEQIIKYAEDNKIDLITIASHGRSGPSRWAMGSVSDKVFRAACIPVLMVRAPGCFPGI